MNLFALEMTEPAVYIPGKSVLTMHIYIWLHDKEGQVTCSDALDVTAAVYILRALVLAAYGCVTRKDR